MSKSLSYIVKSAILFLCNKRVNIFSKYILELPFYINIPYLPYYLIVHHSYKIIFKIF